MDTRLLRDCAARIAANSAFLAAPDAVLARLWNLCPVVQQEQRAFCQAENSRQALVALLGTLVETQNVPETVLNELPKYIDSLEFYMPLDVVGLEDQDPFVSQVIHRALQLAQLPAVQSVDLTTRTVALLERIVEQYLAGQQTERNGALFVGVCEGIIRVEGDLPFSPAHHKRLFGYLDAVMSSHTADSHEDEVVEQYAQKLARLSFVILTKMLRAPLYDEPANVEAAAAAARFCVQTAHPYLENQIGIHDDEEGVKCAAIDLLAQSAKRLESLDSEVLQHCIGYFRQTSRIASQEELRRAERALDNLTACALKKPETVATALEFMRTLVVSITFGHLSTNQSRIHIHVTTKAIALIVKCVCELLVEELKHQQFQNSVCRGLMSAAINAAHRSLRPSKDKDINPIYARIEDEAQKALVLLGDILQQVGTVDAVEFAYPGLVDMLTKCETAAMVSAVARQLGRIAVAHRERYFDMVMEMFISTYQRFATSIDNNGNSLAMIEGIANGFLRICDGVRDATTYLRQVLVQIMTMYVSLGTDIHSRGVANGNYPAGTEIGYLLPVIATCIRLLHYKAVGRRASGSAQSSKRLARRSRLSMNLGGVDIVPEPLYSMRSSFLQHLPGEGHIVRHFWYFVVIFRFSVKNAWPGYSVWYDNVLTIARHSPPLLVYRGGAAVGFLDSELEYTPALKAGAPESLITELRNMLPNPSKFRHLGFQHLVFLLAVQQLESHRAKQLEFRPMLLYLGDEGIESSVALQGSIDVVAKHVFDVYLDSAHSRYKAHPENTHVRVQRTFVFILSRCCHRYERVRKLAVQFAYGMMEKFPHLMWDRLCTSVLLDLLQVVSTHLKQSELEGLEETLSDPKWSEITGRLDLPEHHSALSSALTELFALAYQWLSRAVMMVPAEMTAVLHEYAISFKEPSVSHVGVSLAKEMTSSSGPTAHHFDGMRDHTSAERAAAAARVAQNLPKRNPAKSTHASFTTGVAMKALYIGEVKGLLLAASAISSAELVNSATDPAELMVSSYLHQFTALLARERVPLDQVTQYMYRGGAILRSLLAGKEEETDYTILSRWEPLDQLGETDSLDLPSTPTQFAESSLRSITDTLVRILHLISWAPARHFDVSVVESAVFVWRWIITAYPNLSALVLAEAVGAFKWTVAHRMGLFFRDAERRSVHDVDLLRPADPTTGREEDTSEQTPSQRRKDNPAPHFAWLSFFVERLDAAPESAVPVVHALQTALAQPAFLSQDPRAFGARFVLLNLCMKAIRKSFAIPSLLGLSERRILREKVFEAALLWFDSPMTWSEPFVTAEETRENLNALVLFIDQTQSDQEYWKVDYGDEVDALTGTIQSVQSGVALSKRGLPRMITGASMSFGDPVFSPYEETPILPDVRASFLEAVGSGITQRIAARRSTVDLLPKPSDSSSVPAMFSDVDSNHPSETPSNARRKSFLGYYTVTVSPILKRIEATRGLLTLLLIHELERLETFHHASVTHQQSKHDVGGYRSHKYRLPQRISGPEMVGYLRTAWLFKPSLTMSLVERFPTHKSLHRELDQIVQYHSSELRGSWQAVRFLVTIDSIAENRRCLRDLMHWAPAPAYATLGLMARCYGGYSFARERHVVMQYCLRSLQALPPEVVQFYLSQLVQLLRDDLENGLADFLYEAAQHSMLVAHQLLWLLQTEAGDPQTVDENDQRPRHGYCKQREGLDPLPRLTNALWKTIVAGFGAAERLFYEQEFGYFEEVTAISGLLKDIKDKDTHNAFIRERLEQMTLFPTLYLPTAPYSRVVSVDVNSGTPMQSAAKCPYLLVFHVEPFDGPDAALEVAARDAAVDFHLQDEKSDGEDSMRPSLAWEDGADVNGHEPLHSRDLSRSPKPHTGILKLTSKLSFKTRELRNLLPKDFNRKLMQKLGNLKLKRTKRRLLLEYGFDDETRDDLDVEGGQAKSRVQTQACIFKVYDDCRQDAMTVQLIRLFKECFDHAGLKLYLMPYNVIPNRTGPDRAIGGIIEVVPRVKSRDQIGKSGSKELLQYFTNQFGRPGSFGFQKAQRNFATSLAGYAIVCYLLSIKDRHNGNLLFDSEGHVIHIDFGFLLGISPGGNLGFETAAFKLTNEMMDILGGSTDSEAFHMFVEMTIRGFLAARQLLEPVMVLITAQADSGLPCFMYRDDNLEKLRARFVPHMTDVEAARYMRSLINDAIRKWTTTVYDGIQKLQNNIHSDTWR